MVNMFLKFKKTQSSIEFIILVSAVLFFFVLFFLAIQGNMSDKLNERRDLLIKEAVTIVRDEISLASISSDGYFREFKIPEKIGSKDYEIIIQDNMVYAYTTDEKHAVALPVEQVQGQIQKGANVIKKIDGVVKLNQ